MEAFGEGVREEGRDIVIGGAVVVENWPAALDRGIQFRSTELIGMYEGKEGSGG